VEAAVGVRDARGGHGSHGTRGLAVAAEEVAEASEDARYAVVVRARARGQLLPAEEDNAREAAAVRSREASASAATSLFPSSLLSQPPPRARFYIQRTRVPGLAACLPAAARKAPRRSSREKTGRRRWSGWMSTRSW